MKVKNPTRLSVQKQPKDGSEIINSYNGIEDVEIKQIEDRIKEYFKETNLQKILSKIFFEKNYISEDDMSEFMSFVFDVEITIKNFNNCEEIIYDILSKYKSKTI